jgi:DNA-binding transcriptional regulator YiaG
MIISINMTKLTDKDTGRVELPPYHPQTQRMITGAQIRAARALLRISAAELARRAGVTERTIQRAESVDGMPKMRTETLARIQAVLETAGIEFTAAGPGHSQGVRRRIQ